MFPNGFDGFLNRLEEFNAGDIPSPMPISVLTEPDSDETPYQNPTTGLGDSARSDIISARKPERLLSDEKTGEETEAAPPGVGNLEAITEEQKEDFHDEKPVDDWMFNQSTNEKTEAERKISSEDSDDIDEIKKLTAGKEKGKRIRYILTHIGNILGLSPSVIFGNKIQKLFFANFRQL